jgi:pimeloyl-ACP methyl ester carboxylesterase
MSEFVLVHGAGTGGWLWDGVADRLRERGHTVHAPTLTGVGADCTTGGPETDVSTHVADIVGLVDERSAGSPVLVGFSYSGVVIAGVAEALPGRVAELIFLEAFVPRAGHCLFDLFPPAVSAAMQASAGDGWRVAPVPVTTVGGIGAREDGVDEQRVLAALARRGQQPIGTYRQVLAEPFQHSAGVPRRYISCTDKPPGDPLVAMAAALRSAGWRVDELPTGHFAMLTMPERLAALLSA